VIADPYAIFAAARQHWQSAVYPKQISYGIAVTVTRSGVTSQAHYHAAYDAVENRVHVTPVSDEELAHPYTPHGINFTYSLFGGAIPASSPQRTFDYLGVPVLAPDYSFGIVPTGTPPNTTQDPMELVREIRTEFHDPFPPKRRAAQDGGLKTIALVVVAHRQYKITLDGTQAVDGHADYHLLLEPVSDPATYRLREMWVETSTYDVDRVITAGNFTAPDLEGVRWETNFRDIAGTPYIATETALSGFSLDRRPYDTATVAFTDIAPADNGFILSSMAPFATNSQTAPPVLIEPAKPR
jgi:hypothetical protein